MTNFLHLSKKLLFTFLTLSLLMTSLGCTSEEKKVIRLDMLTTVLGMPIDSPVFSLKDNSDNDFNTSRFKDNWTFLFFGYISCPDICPATMDKFNEIYEDLAKKGDLNNTSFVMVSVDPFRDTLKGLTDYVTYFNNKFIGVTGKDEEIMKLAKKFAIMYKSEDTSKEGYEVGHSTSILLIDPKGRQLARFSAPHNATTITSDFRKIRNKYN